MPTPASARSSSRSPALALPLVALTAFVLAGCSRATTNSAASRPGVPAPLVLSSEFSSGRVVASDGMGAAMVTPAAEPSVAGVEGQ